MTPASATVGEVRARFADGGHGAYPIVDGSALVGIVARGDLLRDDSADDEPLVDHASTPGLTAAPAEERPERSLILVRVAERLLLRLARAECLEEERHGVDPESGKPQLQPESHDPGHLVAHRRVGHVEVGLVLVEPVQVVLAGLVVTGPEALLLVGEDDALFGVGWRLVAPDVPVPLGRLAAAARLLEPRVLVRGVVDDQVCDHAHAAVVRGADELHEVAERAEPRVDVVEVDDVVAVVAVRRREERHEPYARHAEPVEMVDALGEADEVAAAVTVAVGEGLHVEAVDDRVLVPEIVDHAGSSQGTDVPPAGIMRHGTPGQHVTHGTVPVPGITSSSEGGYFGGSS